MIIDRNGLGKIKKVFDNIITIFVYSTPDEVRCRLKERSRDPEEYKRAVKRLSHDLTLDEFDNLDIADYVVVNNNNRLDEALEQLDKYVEIERNKHN